MYSIISCLLFVVRFLRSPFPLISLADWKGGFGLFSLFAILGFSGQEFID